MSGGGPARSRLCVAAPTRTRSRKTRAHTTPCPCASTCSPTVTVHRTIVGAPQRAWRGVVRARRGHGFFRVARRASSLSCRARVAPRSLVPLRDSLSSSCSVQGAWLRSAHVVVPPSLVRLTVAAAGVQRGRGGGVAAGYPLWDGRCSWGHVAGGPPQRAASSPSPPRGTSRATRAACAG